MIWLLCLLLIVGCSGPGFAMDRLQKEIPEDVAIRVIIGESSDQGLHGMICVGEVLRRRGSTNGFYGLRSKHIDNQPVWVWKMAHEAWHQSAYTNYTNNATHFESSDFPKPAWAKNMKLVYRWKKHYFYRKI